jgi:pyruvate/2-oxoglutarate dehydrogenase complex dihydrolipoamide dehydrogenase (E3) component
VRHGVVPRVTFADPEVGRIGITELEALDAGRDVVHGAAMVLCSSNPSGPALQRGAHDKDDGWRHGLAQDGRAARELLR